MPASSNKRPLFRAESEDEPRKRHAASTSNAKATSASSNMASSSKASTSGASKEPAPAPSRANLARQAKQNVNADRATSKHGGRAAPYTKNPLPCPAKKRPAPLDHDENDKLKANNPPTMPDTNYAETAYQKLANEILHHASRPSRLPPMIHDLKDPFYKAFATPFSLPKCTEGKTLPLPHSYYVRLALDTALPPANLQQHLRSGLDAFHVFFAWLSKIKADQNWVFRDTINLFDRLDAIKACLIKSVVPLLAAPTANQSLPASSTSVLNTPSTTTNLSCVLKTDPPLHPPSSTPNSSNLNENTSISPTAIQPQLPDNMESHLSQIEHYARFDSNILIGVPAGSFATYFTVPFQLANPYEKNEVWETLNGQLDVEIGIDELPEKLRLGPHGFDGLFRQWLVQSRKFEGWNSECDGGITAKLPGILNFIKKKMKTPLLTSTPTSPVLTSNPTPRVLTLAAPAPLLTSAVPAHVLTSTPTMPVLTSNPKPPVSTLASPAPVLTTANLASTHPAPASKSPLTAVSTLAAQDQPDEDTSYNNSGQAIPISSDVRTIATRDQNSPIWKIVNSPLFNITATSIKSRQIMNEDIPRIYQATLNLLYLRRQGMRDMTSTSNAPLLSHPPFKVNPDVGVRDWINKTPSKFQTAQLFLF